MAGKNRGQDNSQDVALDFIANVNTIYRSNKPNEGLSVTASKEALPREAQNNPTRSGSVTAEATITNHVLPW